MNAKIWIIIIMVAALIAGLLFYLNNTSDSEDEIANTTLESSQETSTPVDEVPANFEETTLEAVGDYTGSGIATRSINGTFVHEVMANLSDPAEGKFYEGWLVGSSFFSTGELVKESNGEWSLLYETNSNERDFSVFNNIVITEETSANGLDGVPEDHVLEGEFLVP